MKKIARAHVFKSFVGLLSCTVLAASCVQKPTQHERTTSSANELPTEDDQTLREGLTAIAGVECDKPVENSWPTVSVHIPNNGESAQKIIVPKSVEIEILSNMNKRLKSFTMLKEQKKGTLALGPIVNTEPLKVRIAQNFVWKNGKKNHQLRNVVYVGPVDRANICLNLPQYRTVKATIYLSPEFIDNLVAKKLDMTKGYIEARNQLGELSVDMKVRYDNSRSTAGIPKVWQTEILLKSSGGQVTFTPAPWSSATNEFTRQDSVSVDVSPNQQEISVNLD